MQNSGEFHFVVGSGLFVVAGGMEDLVVFDDYDCPGADAWIVTAAAVCVDC